MENEYDLRLRKSQNSNKPKSIAPFKPHALLRLPLTDLITFIGPETKIGFTSERV